MILGVKRVMLILLAAILISAVVPCGAYVVTVSESSASDLGWSWVSNYGLCFLSNAGPCLDESYGFKYGSGAFYGQCGYGTAPPPIPPGDNQTSTNWIGTDKHAGQSLEGVQLTKIKKMTYSTWVSKQWTRKGGSGEWQWPRMPFQLQITFLTAEGARRQVWYRPWGTAGDPRGSPYSSAHLGYWEEWDAYNCVNGDNQPSGLWYECYTETPGGFFYGPWTTGNPQNPGVVERWPGATLVATSTTNYDWNLTPPLPSGTDRVWRSAGWDKNTSPAGNPTCTATGKCINFVVGARKGTTSIFGSQNPPWYTESIGFKGYVDNFTLGVDFDDDGLEANEIVTYDFETDNPRARIVAMNNGALYSQPGNPKHLFRFKIFGRVLGSEDGYVGSEPIPDPNGNEFWLWDGSIKTGGSGARIPACWQVICPNNDVAAGDYVSVIGRAEPRFYFKTDPSAFWTNPLNLEVLHIPQSR